MLCYLRRIYEYEYDTVHVAAGSEAEVGGVAKL